MQVKYFKPHITGKELIYIQDLIEKQKDLSGDGEYTHKVHDFLKRRYGVPHVLLTTSCSTALELAMRLLNLKSGDEVIVPSFTFSSTVNAIISQQHAVRVVFADVSPNTLNIDPDDIARKITSKTRAIFVVHYAGVACDMDAIMKLAKKHRLFVVEDAAQAIDSRHNGRYLGTIGDFGCLSFHDTKNIICGEGGALLINSKDETIIERAEIIREKGTNRSKYFRGEIDKYTWVDIGSSILPSEILAAFLLAQLESLDEIISKRKEHYNFYRRQFELLEHTGLISLSKIPDYAKEHNAHIFYMLARSEADRNYLLDYLRDKQISATFHYIPLHDSPQGRRISHKTVSLPVTESVSKRLIRLPLFTSLSEQERQYVVDMTQQAVRSLASHSLQSRFLLPRYRFKRLHPLEEKLQEKFNRLNNSK